MNIPNESVFMYRIAVLCSLAVLAAACNGAQDKAPGDMGSAGHDSSGRTSAAAPGTAARPGTAAVPGNAAADSASGGSTAVAPASGNHFAEKSGIVQMASQSIPGMTATMYFDDYGARMATVTEIRDSMNGKPITIRNINVVNGHESILYDPLKKVGIRSGDISGALNYFPVFDAMSQSQKAAIAYHPLDARTIMGKPCTGHGFVRNGMQMSVWTWEGIPLRTELNYGSDNAQAMEATSVNTGVAPPSGVFAIPADLKLRDAPATK